MEARMEDIKTLSFCPTTFHVNVSHLLKVETAKESQNSLGSTEDSVTNEEVFGSVETNNKTLACSSPSDY